MCSTTFVIISGVIFASLAYYLYVPFPATSSNPWCQSFVGAGFQLQNLVIWGLEILRISPDYVTRRWTINLMASSVPYKPPNSVEVYETVIDGVDVMVFKPLSVHNGKLLPGLVYFHGGGWVFGSPELHRPLTTFIAEEAETIVVSVDYRLAPEHPFPAAFDDCQKVTEYLLKNGAKFSIDKHRIGVAGDSAGGNLAMAVTLNISQRSDKTIPTIKYQGIFGGALQAFDFKLPSYVKYGTGPNWLTKDDMVDYWLYYLFGNKTLHKEFMDNMHTSSALKQSKFADMLSLRSLPKSLRESVPKEDSKDYGNEALSDKIQDLILDYRVSPMLAPKEALEKLPATYIIGCEFDVLRDESFIAYERMRKANVDLQHKYYRSEGHAFIWGVHSSDIAREAVSEFISFVKRALQSSR